MGKSLYWEFEKPNKEWLEQQFQAAPYFKGIASQDYEGIAYTYYEYRSPNNSETHPDFVALATDAGIKFIDYGDSKVMETVLDYLRPLIEERFGKIDEIYG